MKHLEFGYWKHVASCAEWNIFCLRNQLGELDPVDSHRSQRPEQLFNSKEKSRSGFPQILKSRHTQIHTHVSVQLSSAPADGGGRRP